MRRNSKLSRRRFVASTTALAAASIVPRHVLGGPGQTAPSDQLNLAVIGTGGRGIENIRNLLKHRDVHITAICDVAEFWDNSQIYYRHNGGRGPAMDAIENHYRKSGLEARHHCAVYADFRVMLEKAGKDIDAVVVATPNHVHAVASMAAIHAGKGVYCEMIQRQGKRT